MATILTKWDFHRVQEHLNRSSNEEVMTFRSWRSHMNRQPYPASPPNLPCPNYPFRPDSVPTVLHRNMAGILTQWAFHRVQEHPKQSSDEEVMTFRSWMSHMNRQPYLDGLPNLVCPNSPFRPAPVPTALHKHMDRILTQWAFHIV